MPEPKILKTYGVIADLLSVQRDQVVDLIGGVHWGEVGEHREEILRAMLETRLPARLKVSHGFVLHSDMRVSRQLDVIVWDKQNHAALFERGRFAIVSPRSVVGIIEVKSNLDGEEAEDAAATIRSAKALVSPDAKTPMFGAIFAYNTSSRVDTLLRGIGRAVLADGRDAMQRLSPDLVVTLERPFLSVAGWVRLVVRGEQRELPVFLNYVPLITGSDGAKVNLGPMSLLAQLLFVVDHFWVQGRSSPEAEIADAPDLVQGVAAQYSGFAKEDPLIWTLGTLDPEEQERFDHVRDQLGHMIPHE